MLKNKAIKKQAAETPLPGLSPALARYKTARKPMVPGGEMELGDKHTIKGG